jgi:hypothetical protein
MQFAVYHTLVKTGLLNPQSSCCDCSRPLRLEYPNASVMSFQKPFVLLLNLLRFLIDDSALIIPNLRPDE